MALYLHSFYFSFPSIYYCWSWMMLLKKNQSLYPHLSYIWVHVNICMHIHVYVTAITALFHFHVEKWDLPLFPCIHSSLSFTLLILRWGFKNSELISSPCYRPLVFQRDSWVKSLSSLLIFPTKTIWVSQCSNLLLKLPWCSFTLHLHLGCCCKISVLALFHFVHSLNFLLLFISCSF